MRKNSFKVVMESVQAEGETSIVDPDADTLVDKTLTVETEPQATPEEEFYTSEEPIALINDAVDDIETVNRVIEVFEDNPTNITPAAAEITNEIIEHIADRNGVPTDETKEVTLEQYNTVLSRIKATEVALEGFKELKNRIWQAIVTLIGKIKDFVSSWFSKKKTMRNRIDRRLLSMRNSLRELEKNPSLLYVEGTATKGVGVRLPISLISLKDKPISWDQYNTALKEQYQNTKQAYKTVESFCNGRLIEPMNKLVRENLELAVPVDLNFSDNDLPTTPVQQINITTGLIEHNSKMSGSLVYALRAASKGKLNILFEDMLDDGMLYMTTLPDSSGGEDIDRGVTLLGFSPHVGGEHEILGYLHPVSSDSLGECKKVLDTLSDASKETRRFSDKLSASIEKNIKEIETYMKKNSELSEFSSNAGRRATVKVLIRTLEQMRFVLRTVIPGVSFAIDGVCARIENVIERTIKSSKGTQD